MRQNSTQVLAGVETCESRFRAKFEIRKRLSHVKCSRAHSCLWLADTHLKLRLQSQPHSPTVHSCIKRGRFVWLPQPEERHATATAPQRGVRGDPPRVRVRAEGGGGWRLLLGLGLGLGLTVAARRGAEGGEPREDEDDKNRRGGRGEQQSQLVPGGATGRDRRLWRRLARSTRGGGGAPSGPKWPGLVPCERTGTLRHQASP